MVSASGCLRHLAFDRAEQVDVVLSRLVRGAWTAFEAAATRMLDDLIPHPFASILFALVLGALFLWQGFEENRPPKRLAHVRPAVLTEKPQAARLSQQIQSVSLRGETDIKPKPTKKIY